MNTGKTGSRLLILAFIATMAAFGAYRSEQRTSASDDRIDTLTQWKVDCSRLEGELIEFADDYQGCVPKHMLIFLRRLPKK